MGDEWDDLTDLAVVRDDWEGEDDVQDDWDAEEKPATPVVPAAAPPKKTVKPIVPKELPLATETEQERKVRLDRLVKERDLDNAMGLFGLSLEARNVEQEPSSRAPSEANTLLFETFTPTNIPEFDHFSRIITKRLEAFESHKHYPLFLEGLVNALMSRRDVPEIRKIAGVLSDMAAVKLREKQAAAKIKPPPSLKGAKKGSSGRYDDFDDFGDGDGFDD